MGAHVLQHPSMRIEDWTPGKLVFHSAKVIYRI